MTLVVDHDGRCQCALCIDSDGNRRPDRLSDSADDVPRCSCGRSADDSADEDIHSDASDEEKVYIDVSDSDGDETDTTAPMDSPDVLPRYGDQKSSDDREDIKQPEQPERQPVIRRQNAILARHVSPSPYTVYTILMSVVYVM